MSKANVQTAINDIEKFRTGLSELTQLIDNLKEEIGKELTEGNGLLEEILNKVNTKLSTLEQLEEKQANLKKALNDNNNLLQEKQYKKEVLVSENDSKKKDIDQLSSLILGDEKTKTEIQTEIVGKEERVVNLKQEIEEHKALIETTKEDMEKDIEERNSKKRQIDSELTRIITRSKALKYLIKKNMVNLPEIKVIRSLNVPGVDTEANIRKTSGVADQIVRKILMDLDERGIISFETLSGKVQKRTEIDI